jgi:hypothetical protein
MMRNATTMRYSSRLLAAALLLGFAGALGGCSSLPTPSWDPTDLLDFLDTKKRTPGERKPVFPEGVPGITQGVPKEMIRGSAESRAAAEAQAAAAVQPVEAQPAPPPAKRSAAKRPPAQASSQVEIAPDDVNVEDQPAPPPRRQAQRSRTTAPPPEQPQANPFPAPLPR